MEKKLRVAVDVTAVGLDLDGVDQEVLQTAAEQAVHHCLGRAGDAGLRVFDDHETRDTEFCRAGVEFTAHAD